MSEIELHRKLLGDSARNQAFHAALKQLVVPGKTTVVDIGAGTGFLSFLACQLGASHCTLIEYSDMLDIAEQLARDNRIANLSFIKAHSAELRRAPKADLVISETLGNFALEEGMLETLVDGWRFLAKGGSVLPIGLKQSVAPVISPRLHEEIDIWPRVGYQLDLSAAREVALNNMYVKSVQLDDLGGSGTAPRQWDAIDFRPTTRKPSSLRRGSVHWRGRELGKHVYGFALWWEVELIPGLTLSTSPFAPPTHWEQIYLPLLQPLQLQAADTVELKLGSDTRREAGLGVSWETRQLRAGKLVLSQSQDIRRGRI
jgi:protein arginine N-methyltransferase 1